MIGVCGYKYKYIWWLPKKDHGSDGHGRSGTLSQIRLRKPDSGTTEILTIANAIFLPGQHVLYNPPTLVRQKPLQRPCYQGPEPCDLGSTAGALYSTIPCYTKPYYDYNTVPHYKAIPCYNKILYYNIPHYIPVWLGTCRCSQASGRSPSGLQTPGA